MLLKTPLEMLDGFQLAKKPEGQSVNKLLLRHASAKSLPLFKFNNGKLEILVLFHVAKKFVPLLKSMSLGKLVSPLDCHALLKFAPLLMSSAGKDVSEEQLLHVLGKFVTLPVSMNGKEVSEVQLFHVLFKSVTLAVFTLLNSTRSFLPYQ